MTTARALLFVSLLSLASAGVVALVSRAPADLRNDRPGPTASDPARGAEFSDREVQRHGAYREPAYAGLAIGIVLEVAVLLLVAKGPLRSVLAGTDGWPGGWVMKSVVAAVFVGAVTWLASLPLAYVRGFEIQQAWGLSTQSAPAWLGDSLRSLVVSIIIAAVAATTFFGLVRWQPRTWWIWAWAGFTALTALLFFLYPVAIAPLFNRFTPLDDPSLERDIRSLASEAGVEVDQVLVADASRRSTLENAYVAGLGRTRQVVLYDTLLTAGGPAETRFVVAHELAHDRENHVLKNLALSSAGLLTGFAVLALLAHRTRLWSWAGAEGVADQAALPLLMVFATAATLVLLPAQNAVSRRFEAHADRIALELTQDPDTAIRVQRRLAFANLADLRPPRVAVWLLYSHPPVAERIAAAVAEKRSEP